MLQGECGPGLFRAASECPGYGTDLVSVFHNFADGLCLDMKIGMLEHRPQQLGIVGEGRSLNCETLVDPVPGEVLNEHRRELCRLCRRQAKRSNITEHAVAVQPP